MGMGSFDVSGLKELQKQLEKQKKSVDSFVESCERACGPPAEDGSEEDTGGGLFS